MRMIVKVQVPQFMVGGGLGAYLVHNENRSVRTMLPMGEIPLLDDAMKQSPVRFFFAETSNSDDTNLDIDFATPCVDPGW